MPWRARGYNARHSQRSGHGSTRSLGFPVRGCGGRRNGPPRRRRAPPGFGRAVAVTRPSSPEDHRRQDDPHRSRRDTTGRGEGDDERARPLRPRLRDLHPTGLRRRHRRGAVPEAVPPGPRRLRHRGHLAVELRQLLLAEWGGAVQCHERGRRGPLGHQGQARPDAALPAPRRPVPPGRGPLLSRERRRVRGGRGPGAQGDGAGLPPRAHPGRRARPRHLRSRGRGPERQADRRPAEPHPRLGARTLRADGAPSLRAHAGEARRRGRAAARRSRAHLAVPRRCSSARTSRDTAPTSSKTPSRPRRTTTSRSCGRRRACPWPWASSSTTSRSTCPSSRVASSTSSAPTSRRSAASAWRGRSERSRSSSG